ncbi:hypothetical protein HK405_004325 [Cladochytrium tenue]|nr:hypothetical protein HK405_004325 [Cladochytrium tenue]
MQLVGAAANAPMLDQNDPDLRLVLGRDDLNPIALFRTVDEDFFLCFQAYLPPYVAAMSPNLLEVYHLSSGELVQAEITFAQRCLLTQPDAVYVSRAGDVHKLTLKS